MSISNPLQSTQAGQSVASRAPVRLESLNPQMLLANRLAERLGLAPGTLSASQADNFTPDKVAERILGFVGGRLQRDQAEGADNAALEKRMQQAVSGIEKGFAEARKILEGMGLLQGKVAADIDQTWDKIQSGMQGLRERYLTPAATQTDTTRLRASSTAEALAQRFELDVTTRDGDRLRISVAQASASLSETRTASTSKAAGEQGSVVFSRSEMRVGQWQVQLEGELDDGEREALADLLEQVQGMADRFYAGDLQGAFERALTLEMDNSQLASMSLNMSQARVSQASAAYGEVAGQGRAASLVNDSLRDYTSGLLDTLKQANAVSNDAGEWLASLLDGGFSLDNRFDQGRLDKAQALNGKLLDGLQGLLDQGLLEA